MKKMLVLLSILYLFLSSCYFPMTDEESQKSSKKSESETAIVINLVYEWENARVYSEDELCWLGYRNPEYLFPGTELIWKSIKNNNSGNEPGKSPEYWLLFRN